MELPEAEGPNNIGQLASTDYRTRPGLYQRDRSSQTRSASADLPALPPRQDHVKRVLLDQQAVHAPPCRLTISWPYHPRRACETGARASKERNRSVSLLVTLALVDVGRNYTGRKTHGTRQGTSAISSGKVVHLRLQPCGPKPGERATELKKVASPVGFEPTLPP